MYDLIIIGGGMSGLSVGHFFRTRDILILEKNELLSGASGNNAGFLITGFGEHFFRTSQRWGLERALQIQQIHLSSHRRIHELSGSANRCGSLTIGTTPKEVRELRQSYDLMRSAGLNVNWLETAQTGYFQPGPALLNADDGLLDSKMFWQQIARDLPHKTDTKVMQVVEENSALRVVTGAGELSTKAVVYCLNAYSGDLLPELQGRVIPLRGQMLELEIFEDPPLPQPVIAEYGEIYWNFTANTLRFGGLEYMIPEDEIGLATSLSPRVLEAQLNWIHNNLRVSHGPASQKTWFATMGFTVDGFPLVGRLPGRKDQYVLAGMCGIGHSYAMECAYWIHELIINNRTIIPDYFSSDRIKTLPHYTGGDWRSLYEAWNH